MSILSLFSRRTAAPAPFTASEAGRALAEMGRLSERERYRTTARAMWAQQRPGEALPAFLEPRG